MRRLPKCFHKTIFIDVLKGEEISHTRVSKEFFSVCGRELGDFDELFIWTMGSILAAQTVQVMTAKEGFFAQKLGCKELFE